MLSSHVCISYSGRYIGTSICSCQLVMTTGGIACLCSLLALTKGPLLFSPPLFSFPPLPCTTTTAEVSLAFSAAD